LFSLQIVDLPLQDLEIGEFSMVALVFLPLLHRRLALGDQRDLASTDQTRFGIAFCLYPALALLRVLFAEVEGDLAAVQPFDEEIFFIREVKHIIVFIISMQLFISSLHKKQTYPIPVKDGGSYPEKAFE
jgi:hypothetical protein